MYVFAEVGVAGDAITSPASSDTVHACCGERLLTQLVIGHHVFALSPRCNHPNALRHTLPVAQLGWSHSAVYSTRALVQLDRLGDHARA